MAIINSQNNIRYTIDKFSYFYFGTVASRVITDLDFSNVASVPSIELDFSKPGNSEIFLAFLIDSYYDNASDTQYNYSWFAFNSSGGLVFISDVEPDIVTLSNFGNTPESLLGISDFNILVGKKVGVAFGLKTDNIKTSVPKIKIGFKVTYNDKILTYTEYSQKYLFDTPIVINYASVDKTEFSGGNVNVTAQVDKVDGSRSNYMSLQNLRGQKVTGIQFKADYSVPEIGSAYSKVNQASIIYSPNSYVTSGLNSGEIITITQNWFRKIKQVRMNVKHTPLIDTRMTAYVAFRSEPVLIKSETLGIGDGTRKAFSLSHKEGIFHDKVKIYYDGVQNFSDFEINTQAGVIYCTAPKGVLVSCDYEYGYDYETWQELALTEQYGLDDYERTEFRLNIPDNTKSVCALKVKLTMTDGKILNEHIGSGTGYLTTYKLSHKVKDGDITVLSNGAALANSNWALMDDTQYVKIAAEKNATLSASYDWISETPEIYQIAAVFG